MKKSLPLIGGYIVGLAAVALLVLYALPLVAIGDWRPFDTELVRWLTITLVSLGALGYLGYTLYTQTRRASRSRARPTPSPSRRTPPRRGAPRTAASRSRSPARKRCASRDGDRRCVGRTMT